MWGKKPRSRLRDMYAHIQGGPKVTGHSTLDDRWTLLKLYGAEHASLQ